MNERNDLSKEYPPSASQSLEKRPIGSEKHSEYDLFQYVWSRIPDLSDAEINILINRVKDDELIRDEIEGIIQKELVQKAQEVIILLISLRKSLQQGVEGSAGIDVDVPDRMI